MLLTTGAKTRELLRSGISHVLFLVQIGLWVKPQKGINGQGETTAYACLTLRGHFESPSALPGRHSWASTVQFRASHPTPPSVPSHPFPCPVWGDPGWNVGSWCVQPYAGVTVSVGAGRLAVECLLSPDVSPGRTSSRTRPMPTIIASRCTRLTRRPTARPVRCSSGSSLLPPPPTASPSSRTLCSAALDTVASDLPP